MLYIPLPDLLKTWSTSVKSINLQILAISALIKKIALMNISEIVPEDAVSDFVLFSITNRFDTLVIELSAEWEKIVSIEFANQLHYALEIFQVDSKIYDEDSFEYGKLILGKIDQLRRVSITDSILEILSTAKNMSKLAIISDMLEERLESHFTLPLLKQNSE